MITPTHLPGLSICRRRGYWPQSAVALHSVICSLWTKDDHTSSVMSKCTDVGEVIHEIVIEFYVIRFDDEFYHLSHIVKNMSDIVHYKQ